MSELTLEEMAKIKKDCSKPNKGTSDAGVTVYECPICKKVFAVSNPKEWTYKRLVRGYNVKQGGIYFCSYGCVRKHDKAFEKKKKPLISEP